MVHGTGSTSDILMLLSLFNAFYWLAVRRMPASLTWMLLQLIAFDTVLLFWLINRRMSVPVTD